MAGLIGQRLGQYEITALIGRGGMATVYRARQASINRDVALKVIRPDLVETGDFIVRFQREAQAVASLSHPFILKVFDYGHEGDLLYLVMELLRGGSLADLMSRNNGPLSLDLVSRTADQLGSALDYAHGLGIIHRDLKPQNVLLDEQGNAHLTDFGIAKILSETTALTQTGMAMGTPAYMSPEQWMGQPLDARTDVYAFGAMLFEMLTGRLPFSAETPASLMYKHLQEPPPSIRNLQTGLPRAVDAVIAKALAKDPQQRFASAGALASALKSALTGQLPIPVPPSRASGVSDATILETPGAGSGTWPPHGSRATAPARFPGALVGAIVVILAVVLIGGYVLLSRRGAGGAGGGSGSTATVPVSVPATTQAAVLLTSTGVQVTTPIPVAINSSTTPTAVTLPTQAASPVPPTILPPTAIPSSTIDARTPAAQTAIAGSTRTAQALPTTAQPNETETLQVEAALGSTRTAQVIPATPIPPTIPPATPVPADTNTPVPPTATNVPVAPTVPPIPAVTTLAPTNTALPPTPVPATPIPAVTNTAVPPTVPPVVPTLVPTYTQPVAATPAPTVVPTTAVTLTGRVIFASNRGGRYQIYIADAANPQSPRPLLTSNADDFGPGVSADGSRIAFTSNRAGGNQIYVANIDGSNVHRLVNVPGDNYAPAWSPDGTRIVFHNNRSGNWQLYIVKVDGSGLRRVTNDSADNADATWAPDGIHIAYHSKQRDGTSAVFTLDVNGSAPSTRLSPANLDANDPAWSPDGQYIAFTVVKNKQPSLYLMDADGTNMHPLLTQAGATDQPAWSPDSHFVVFRSKQNGQTGIYIADVKGGNVRQITNTATDNQFPAWSDAQ